MRPLERRRLGHTDLHPTHLSFGSSHMGGLAHAITPEEARQTIDRMYALGLRHLDTAPLYGRSEENVGLALRDLAVPELTISTKVGTHPDRPHRYTAEDIRWSLDNSSALLARDHFEAVLIHDPPSMDPVMAPGNGFDTLDALRDEGRLDAIGLGCRSLDFHKEAIDAGRVDLILTYADYNLVRRTAVPLIQHARANGVGIVLGSPQMQGLLAHGDPMVAIKVRPYRDMFPPDDLQGAGDWYAWCRERHVDLRHLNMQFVLANDDIDVVLTGAASVYEIETNLREATTPIPKDVWVEALDRVAELDERAT